MSAERQKDALDEAAEWFFRQGDCPLAPDDHKRFDQWLAASPEHRTAYDEVSRTWTELARIAPPPLPRPVPPVGTRRPFARVAASAGTIAALLLVAAWSFDLPTRLRADAYTATGETRSLTLADGSTVELNSSSAIAVDYSDAARSVTLLKGEAVFTVAPDKTRSFKVLSGDGEATALGTIYDVRDGEDGSTVTVLESQVRVSSTDNAFSSVTLSAGEQVRYDAGGMGTVTRVDVASEAAWRRGKLIFIERPLGSVVEELNRHHRGIIRIVGDDLRDRRINGVFELADIATAVDTLETSLGIRSTRLGNYMIVLHR
ncbi:FecR family protein [Ensifer sp. 4252]|uniref:FecR family protein n=1 Tax=Ensifer sp. 4252 TaxID=3373915 RepID=UPI003D1DEA16